jgi:hypothetical protein
MIPNSRATLVEYCLRNLGAPVIEINIDEDQLEDRVDEAIQFYQEYHSDAVTRTFVKHVVTQDNIDDGYITLPDSVLSIRKVLAISNTSVESLFSAKYQMYHDDLAGVGTDRLDIVNIEMTKQYLSLLENILSGSSQQIVYSRHKNTLTIHGQDAGYLTLGKYIIIECYQALNPETYTEVYNDLALKRYLTALIKRNWGTNLIKFEGMQLPGGVTINGRAIFDDAVTEIKEMEELWVSKYQTPTDFFVG